MSASMGVIPLGKLLSASVLECVEPIFFHCLHLRGPFEPIRLRGVRQNGRWPPGGAAVLSVQRRG